MNSTLSGLSLIMVSALCGAAYAVPLKMRKRYSWENTWLLGWFFAMIVLPLLVISLVLPGWMSAIRAAGSHVILIAAVFGFLWGLGAVTFAIGINSLGLSLGYAVIMGIVTAFGAMIPMARRWAGIPVPARLVVITGITIGIVGVAVCGRAGMLRERDLAVGNTPLTGPRSGALGTKAFFVALAWCIASGIFSAGNNLGFDFSGRVAVEARRIGASPLTATLDQWMLVFGGCFIAILFSCGRTLIKNETWKLYSGPGAGRDAWFAILMGLLQFVTIVTYGMGAYFIGRLGTTVGFAMMVSSTLILANVFGFMMGEWKSAPKSSVLTLFVGLMILILAVVTLAFGNGMIPSQS